MAAYSDYFAAECLVSISSGPVLHRPTPVVAASAAAHHHQQHHQPTAMGLLATTSRRREPEGSREDREVRETLRLETTSMVTVAGILTDLHGGGGGGGNNTTNAKFRPMSAYSESSNSSSCGESGYTTLSDSTTPSGGTPSATPIPGGQGHWGAAAGGAGDPRSPVKRHQCTFDGCDRVYGKSSHLKAHVRTHTEDRRTGSCGAAEWLLYCRESVVIKKRVCREGTPTERRGNAHGARRERPRSAAAASSREGVGKTPRLWSAGLALLLWSSGLVLLVLLLLLVAVVVVAAA
ncbi:hypothetical protein CRUP_033363, partial [Coryphaenoides rupestris]